MHSPLFFTHVNGERSAQIQSMYHRMTFHSRDNTIPEFAENMSRLPPGVIVHSPAAIVSPLRLNNILPISLFSLNVSMGIRMFETPVDESNIVFPRKVTLILADMPFNKTRGLLLIVVPVTRSTVSRGVIVAGIF